MITLKKNGEYYYIKYTGNSLPEYMKYAKLLSSVTEKYYDEKEKSWYCSAVEAQKIGDKLNNKDAGSNLKLSPYDYQRQAIAFCKTEKMGLIQLPCGAGKTPIGLGAFLELRKETPDLRGVFVVKAALKNQWKDEVSKFTDLRANIIFTFKAITKSFTSRIKNREKKIEKLSVSVTQNAKKIMKLKNEIDQLIEERRQVFIEAFDTNKYDIFVINYEVITDEFVRYMLHKQNIQFWYVDEVDCIKSNTTERSKALYEFNQAKYRFGATATPIRKNPKDLFGIFSFIDPELFPSEKEFDRTYLKFWYGRVSGSQNEEQLAKIVEPHIFKRTFEQIADQLPQQIVRQVYCDPTDEQAAAFDRLMKEIDELSEKKKAMYGRFTPAQLAQNAEFQAIENGIAARQSFAQMQADTEELLEISESNLAKKYVTGSKSNKVSTCVSLVEKIIASGEKVCIFSKFIHMQDILKREFAKSMVLKNVEVDCILGNTSAEERSEVLKRHKTMDNHNILLLTDSGEAGLNLSTTRYMIEFELADSAAKQTQRHGRIQRADSIHKNVFVFQLLMRHSWDEIAEKIVSKKKGYAERILE